MTATQLIAKLQELVMDHGDMDILVHQHTGGLDHACYVLKKEYKLLFEDNTDRIYIAIE